MEYVHIFVEIPPTMSVSKALNLLKGIALINFFKNNHCSEITLEKDIYEVEENSEA